MAHPADPLIRELVQQRRPATTAEIALIVDRLATAPFSATLVSVPAKEQGISYQGITLGPRVNSMSYHLVKRVALEQQWAHGTTAAEYLEDLRTAVRYPEAQLGVYQRRGGLIAVSIAPTDAVLPASRRGTGARPNLIVIYAANRRGILTGYQFSTVHDVTIPGDVPWLRQ